MFSVYDVLTNNLLECKIDHKKLRNALCRFFVGLKISVFWHSVCFLVAEGEASRMQAAVISCVTGPHFAAGYL